MIPYSRPELIDFYTLSQTKLLEKHILDSGTSLCNINMGVSPLPEHEMEHLTYKAGHAVQTSVEHLFTKDSVFLELSA